MFQIYPLLKLKKYTQIFSCIQWMYLQRNHDAVYIDNHIFSNFSYNIFKIIFFLSTKYLNNVIVQSWYYIQILGDKKRLCQIGFTSKKISNRFVKFKPVENLTFTTLGKSKKLVFFCWLRTSRITQLKKQPL